MILHLFSSLTVKKKAKNRGLQLYEQFKSRGSRAAGLLKNRVPLKKIIWLEAGK